MILLKILKIAVFIIYWPYLALTSGFVIIGLTYLLKLLNVSKRKIKAISGIFLIAFMVLANFPPSVVRACTMTILVLLSRNRV